MLDILEKNATQLAVELMCDIARIKLESMALEQELKLLAPICIRLARLELALETLEEGGQEATSLLEEAKALFKEIDDVYSDNPRF